MSQKTAVAQPCHIYIIAGEPSGDALGARLMASLKRHSPTPIIFHGIGGPLMEAEGLKSEIPMSDLAVMGLSEVVPHLKKILHHIKNTVASIKQLRPDVVVTIDAPGFCFRVQRQLTGQGIGLIHYVAPTVWAWKPKRAKKIAAFLDHLMVLLPFEPPYFEKEGLSTTFVGHSVIESGADKADGAAFRAKNNIAANDKLLCVLPGSRGSETSQLLPVFQETVEHLVKQFPDLKIVIPTVETVRNRVIEAVQQWPNSPIVVAGNDHKYACFAAADAALAASGTVSLELSLAGTPTVIAYKVKKLTGWILKRLVKVKFATITNMLLDKEVMHEFIQERCTPDNLAQALLPLLNDSGQRLRQQDELKTAMAMLTVEDMAPSDKAAETVLRVLSDFQARRIP